MEARSQSRSRLAIEKLEAEITELWGHINAAECRFLELVAEFDRREGYMEHGLASTAQWLNWQCGIRAVAGRERVRAARALERLPRIARAFSRGELSYSKVRALTRVATPGNESILLEIAINSTAHHIEKLVRKYARVKRWEDAAVAETQHRKRSLDYHYDEDGSMILRARLPAEIGALVKQSIQAAMDIAERAERESAIADEIQTHSNVSAETSATDQSVERDVETIEEATNEPMSARRADAFVHMMRHFVGCDSVDCDSAADRYQVVVHINQSRLSQGDSDGRAEPLARRRLLRVGERLAARRGYSPPSGL